MDRLAEIQARLDAATPGPWVTKPGVSLAWSELVLAPVPGHDGYMALVADTKDSFFNNHDDADFIAHAPDDLAWLLERVARLETTVHNWEVWANRLDLTRWEGDD